MTTDKDVEPGDRVRISNGGPTGLPEGIWTGWRGAVGTVEAVGRTRARVRMDGMSDRVIPVPLVVLGPEEGALR